MHTLFSSDKNYMAKRKVILPESDPSLPIKAFTKSSVWGIQENDVIRLWEGATRDAKVKENIRHYLDIFKSTFFLHVLNDIGELTFHSLRLIGFQERTWSIEHLICGLVLIRLTIHIAFNITLLTSTISFWGVRSRWWRTSLILSFTGLHPYYTQQLAAQVWETMTYDNLDEGVVKTPARQTNKICLSRWYSIV